MKKVEQYIKERTRNDSNTSRGWHNRGVYIPTTYTPWVVPNVAREAANIAREETIKEVCELIRNNILEYCSTTTEIDIETFIYDMKKILEDKV